jgi:hypothetical protein
MLSKTELNQLLELLKDRIGKNIHHHQSGGASGTFDVEHTVTEAAMIVSTEKDTSESKDASGATASNNTKSTLNRLQEQKLHVVEMRELKTILSRDMKNDKMYVHRVASVCVRMAFGSLESTEVEQWFLIFAAMVVTIDCLFLCTQLGEYGKVAQLGNIRWFCIPCGLTQGLFARWR